MITDVQLAVCANLLGAGLFLLIVLYHYIAANHGGSKGALSRPRNMNWVGGTRARANALRQLNQTKQQHQPSKPLTKAPSSNDEDDYDATSATNSNSNFLTISSLPDPGPSRNVSQRKKFKKTVEEPPSWKKEVNYAAFGYELVIPEPQTRVVPLLEFIEKKFPFGHAMSLQLSFQMDICRVHPSSDY